ncbi:MAG: SDR family oxidoreductase [Candidatus Pelagibacterales bacterium]
MNNLSGKTLFITGATRGIGFAIAKRAAQDGANIVIAANTDVPHPTLPGTIHTAAEELNAVGGNAVGIKTDIRFEEQVNFAVEETVKKFGGIDICINNASAINLSSTLHTDMKRYDLMHNINTRGTFLVSKTCIPHLKKSDNPHILNLGPPLNMSAEWFKPHVAYTMAKYGMSMCTLGMSEELRPFAIAVNSLWPRTMIDTSAVRNILGSTLEDKGLSQCRKPEIMADAAYIILTQDSKKFTGNMCVDDSTLIASGKTKLDEYLATPDAKPLADFFVDGHDGKIELN